MTKGNEIEKTVGGFALVGSVLMALGMVGWQGFWAGCAVLGCLLVVFSGVIARANQQG